ncbi:hypothetical protein [uncultured Pseudodesulfovibrio sp.]|uniref:hypothetical protein n=1 Tax=uncultured Pseudodesulfovibrio sp. TaxID=2035858 RepID=UPI0029C69B62|nr:hypothetical protein [uncultured Pseudodesulfovibrio sp.]
MTADIHLTPGPDHLSVKVTGKVQSIHEIVEYMTIFRNEVARHGQRKVLIDYTEAHFEMDYHDLHELAGIAVQSDFPLYGLRIAVVCLPDELARHRLFETIAVNRSMTYQVCTDLETALSWLLAS